MSRSLLLLVPAVLALGCKKEEDTGDTADLDLGMADAALVGEEAGDGAGMAVAIAPDVNGDGKDELLVGAPLSSTAGGEAGAAYLINGPVEGEGDLGFSDGRITAEYSFGHMGASVTGLGDTNGDSYGDVLIGVPYDSISGLSAGAAYFIAGPFDGDVPLNYADASFEGADDDDILGIQVDGPGDINNDSFSDLLLGVYHEVESQQRAAVGAVFYGPVGGNNDYSEADGIYYGDIRELGEGGWVTTGAGDLDGDSRGDLAFGFSLDDEHGEDAGAIWVMQGPASGQLMLSSSEVYVKGEQSGDYLGQALAGGGDINGDGLDDLLVGAPGEDEGALSGGSIYVLYGPADTYEFAGGAPAKIVAQKANDGVGSAMSGAGDIDGDGFGDVVVGAPGADITGEGSGAAYIVYGPLTGFVNLDNFPRYGGVAANDEAGISVAGGGDLDGDGKGDVLVGAGYNDGGGLDSGAVYVLYGSSL